VEGDVLGQDRDASFPLQVVGVEDAFPHKLGVAELAALAQQAVDQRRLAVVDVGDDGDVANVVSTHGDGQGGHTGDLEYMDMVCKKIAAAVNEAVSKLAPAHLKVAQGRRKGRSRTTTTPPPSTIPERV
jgi:hypothetical protein